MPRDKSKRRKLKHVPLKDQAESVIQDAKRLRVEAELAELDVRASELAVEDEDSVGPNAGWEQRRDQSADTVADRQRIAKRYEAQAALLGGKPRTSTQKADQRREVLRATRDALKNHVQTGEGTLAEHYRQIDAGEGDRSVFAQAKEQGANDEQARTMALDRAELDAYAWEKSLEAAEAKLAEIEGELGPEPVEEAEADAPALD